MNQPMQQSPFQSFSFAVNDDVFVQPVGSSDFLPVGTHEVKIESAEFDNGQYGPQLKCRFVNDKGQSIVDYISIMAQEKPGDKGPKPGYKYLLLGQAILSDLVARVTFLQKQIPTNPHTIDCVKNTRLKLEIVEPTKGYTIRDVNGTKMILDLALNEYVTLEDHLGNTTEAAYASFDEAKAAMEAMGLKRAFNKVKRFDAISTEVQAENQAIMQPVLDQFSGKATAPGAPAAGQPRQSTLAQQRKAAPGRPTV